MFGFGGNANAGKTLRPRKSTMGNKGIQLRQHIDATLGRGGDIMEAVQLPRGEELREWLAVNVVDFYNEACVLYCILEELCTDSTCEVMSAGAKYEYLWADGIKVKKPIKLSAPQYINNLFDWIESQIDDDKVFPQEIGSPFPADFDSVVRTIFKRLFRVYAHIYHSHFKHICELKAEPHLNTCFKHFIFFTIAHNMVDEKELAPLRELIDQILATAKGGGAAAGGSTPQR